MAPHRMVLLWFVACGCGGSATAGVQFASLHQVATSSVGHTEGGLTDPSKPTFDYFRMRFINVSLEHDITADQNPTGVSAVIYLNPECQGDNDTGGCDLQGSGAVHEVKEYFDFTDPAKTNATINRQARSIDPGDYRYVILSFCAGSTPKENVQFEITGGEARTATSGVCGVRSVAADPPIHVAAGASITVTLAYDLQQWLSTGDGSPGSSNGYDAAHLCDLSPTIMPRPAGETAPYRLGWCVGPAAFVPSFAVK